MKKRRGLHTGSGAPVCEAVSGVTWDPGAGTKIIEKKTLDPGDVRGTLLGQIRCESEEWRLAVGKSFGWSVAIDWKLCKARNPGE